jgi:hypothetical protein
MVLTSLTGSGGLDESVEIVDSLCFELFGKSHERHKYCNFVDHAYQHCTPAYGAAAVPSAE